MVFAWFVWFLLLNYNAYIWKVYWNNCVPLVGPIGEHMHIHTCRIFMTTKTKRWINLIVTTQQENPLVTKLEEQMLSRNSRAVVKDPSLMSLASFSKEQNNRFFCKHSRRRPLKEALHSIPLGDFNRHLLCNSRKIWGNARLVLHGVSEKPNSNYFSLNYVKEMSLLPDLRKILGGTAICFYWQWPRSQPKFNHWACFVGF